MNLCFTNTSINVIFLCIPRGFSLLTLCRAPFLQPYACIELEIEINLQNTYALIAKIDFKIALPLVVGQAWG